jgi:hypothetical protein
VISCPMPLEKQRYSEWRALHFVRTKTKRSLLTHYTDHIALFIPSRSGVQEHLQPYPSLRHKSWKIFGRKLESVFAVNT